MKKRIRFYSKRRIFTEMDDPMLNLKPLVGSYSDYEILTLKTKDTLGRLASFCKEGKEIGGGVDDGCLI